MSKWLEKSLNILWGIFFAFSFRVANLLTAGVLALFKVSIDNPTLRIITGVVWALIVCAILIVRKENLCEAFRFKIKKEEGRSVTALQVTLASILAFVFGISLNRILTVIINLLPLPESLTSAAETSVAISVDSKSVILIIIAIWIVAPIVEELSYRGLSYFYLEKAGGRWLAIILTCIIFGASHGNYLQGAYAMLAALFSCLFIRLTGSVVTGILIHMGFNGSNFILSQIISAKISNETRNITDVIFAVLAILAFTAIYMISKVDEK